MHFMKLRACTNFQLNHCEDITMHFTIDLVEATLELIWYARSLT